MDRVGKAITAIFNIATLFLLMAAYRELRFLTKKNREGETYLRTVIKKLLR